MLEIICLIWLWRVNGKHAIERGQNPKKYRALTLGLWFGLEFTGTFVGAWLCWADGCDNLAGGLLFTF